MAVKVFESKIRPAGWRFFIQNPKGLTLTANQGRMWEPALSLLFFFIFKPLGTLFLALSEPELRTGVESYCLTAVSQMGPTIRRACRFRGGKSKGVNGLNGANFKG